MHGYGKNGKLLCAKCFKQDYERMPDGCEEPICTDRPCYCANCGRHIKTTLNTAGVEAVSREILTATLNGTVSDNQLILYQVYGHLIISWIRQTMEEEMYHAESI